MDKAKEQKRTAIENELAKHIDLISDPKVKEYILKKKEQKKERELQKQQPKQKSGIMGKDMVMVESSEEESEDESMEEEIKAVEKVKPKKKAIGAGKSKAIKKK